MKTILCFGDSNTHGTMPMKTLQTRGRFDRATRWPGVMASELGEDWHVVEEGHPARTTALDDPVDGIHKSGLRALPILLESHRPLDVVIIMLGTNDVKMRFSLPPGDIAIALEKLVTAIGVSDAGPDGTAPKVLIVAPVPVEQSGCLAEMFAGGAAKSRGLAKAYADVATRHGAAFFDAGSVAKVDLTDGVHLSAEAHGAIGRALAQRLSEV